jgi:hypothetical protein
LTARNCGPSSTLAIAPTARTLCRLGYYASSSRTVASAKTTLAVLPLSRNCANNSDPPTSSSRNGAGCSKPGWGGSGRRSSMPSSTLSLAARNSGLASTLAMTPAIRTPCRLGYYASSSPSPTSSILASAPQAPPEAAQLGAAPPVRDSDDHAVAVADSASATGACPATEEQPYKEDPSGSVRTAQTAASEDGVCLTTGVQLQGPEGAQRPRALSAATAELERDRFGCSVGYRAVRIAVSSRSNLSGSST